MATLENLLTNEAVQQGILYLLGLAVTALLGWKSVKKRNLELIIQSAYVAVSETYEVYVRGIKQAKNGTGKLSDAQRGTARALAYEKLKDILAEEGISLAKYYGPRAAQWLIEKAVTRSKTAGRVAAAALAPFPEPQLPSAFDS